MKNVCFNGGRGHTPARRAPIPVSPGTPDIPVSVDLSRPGEVRAALRAAGFRPSAALGQNFLVDRNVLARMLEASGVDAAETVLEVGPGLGVLTGPLAGRAGRLIAVEKDARLFAWLQRRFGGRANCRLVHGDYLEAAAADPGLHAVDAVVSNLPYSAAGRILVFLALAPEPPRRMLVTVQKEVGERLTAVPGDSAYGLLSVLIGDVYDSACLRTIAPTCFYPAPAVRSAVMVLRRRGTAVPVSRPPPAWLPLLRHAFSRRRQQMLRILAAAPFGETPPGRSRALAWLRAARIPPDGRPENVDVAGWRRLAGECSAWISSGEQCQPENARRQAVDAE